MYDDNTMSTEGMDSTLAKEKEQEYVHQVYEEIASHFSQTRYKPWPVVEKFLLDQKNGSIGLDIGCGNGKYMSVNKNVYMIGSDRSSNLTQIAYDNHAVSEGRNTKHADALVSDGLDLPFSSGRFDFAISIAVIHHFSTPERRIEAVRRILNVLVPGGKALVYVWALEQEKSRRGYHEGMDQDVLVPWVLQSKKKKKEMNQEELEQKPVVHQRYYHLYKEGELESDIKIAGGVVLESGYSRDNWYSIFTKDAV